MALTGQVSKSFTLGGRSYNESTSVTANVGINAEPTVIAAQPGVVATGGGNTSGNLTMTNVSHGVVTGAKVDLYWEDGRLIGATVGTVSGVTVPITASGTFEDGAAALPANTTAINVSVPTTEIIGVTGDNVQMMVVAMEGSSGTEGTFSFWNGNTLAYELLLQANGADAWYLNEGFANPLDGLTITKITFSHNDTAAGVSMKLGLLVS